MKTQEFIHEFEENVVMVEKGTLSLETVLSELEEWDSMAIVSTIALFDQNFGIQISGEKINSCKTLGDLVALVKHKLED